MSTEHSTWLEHHFRAMGSDISLLIEADERSARAGFQVAQELFNRLEALLTRFKPTSELSYLNAHPGRWVGLSPVFYRLLEAALGLARETGGLFDPTVLTALRAAGYTRDIAQVKAGEVYPDIAPGDLRGRWAEVELDEDGNRVRLPDGVQVDLGGIAKGWTAQQAALLAGQYGPCLVDAGGDLAAGAPPRGEPGWPVTVAAPWLDETGEQPDLVALPLAHATLTTSGVDRRRWQNGGRDAHHLIDPRDGRPAVTDLLSASILAVEAAPAEAWATAAVIMGRERALTDFSRRGIASLLVDQDRRAVMTPAMGPFITWIARPEHTVLVMGDESNKRF